MEDKTKKKKIRSQNWLEDEKSLLVNLAQGYMKYIENKNTDTSTNIKKSKAWQKICNSFNELSHRRGPRRTVPQLKTQWNIIKMNIKKKKLAQEIKSTIKADGQGTPVGSVDTNSILSWLPHKFDTDANSSESESKITMTLDYNNSNEETESHHEEQIKQIDPLDDIATVEAQGTTTIHIMPSRTSLDNFEISSDETEQARPIKKKKSKRKELNDATTNGETTNLMATLVSLEKKLKSNLHEIQMKNEHLKQEILLLKLEYWRKKAASIAGQKSELDNKHSTD